MISRARGRVEIARGLVRQQDARLGDEGAGDGHALPLAARHLARTVHHPLTQADALERALRAHQPFTAPQAGVDSGSSTLCSAWARGSKLNVWKHEADFLCAHPRELAVLHFRDELGRSTSTRRRRGCRDSRSCSSASTCRAGRTHDRDVLTTHDREVHAAQARESLRRPSCSDLQVVSLDRGVHADRRPRSCCGPGLSHRDPTPPRDNLQTVVTKAFLSRRRTRCDAAS